MYTTIVRGDPFVTMFYPGSLTPRIYANQRGIIPVVNVAFTLVHWFPCVATHVKIDGTSVDCMRSAVTTTISQFAEFSLEQSDETWRLYPSGPIAIVCTAGGASFQIQVLLLLHYFLFLLISGRGWLLQSASKFVGAWRVALINNCTAGNNVHHCRRVGTPSDRTEVPGLIKLCE